MNSIFAQFERYSGSAEVANLAYWKYVQWEIESHKMSKNMGVNFADS